MEMGTFVAPAGCFCGISLLNRSMLKQCAKFKGLQVDVDGVDRWTVSLRSLVNGAPGHRCRPRRPRRGLGWQGLSTEARCGTKAESSLELGINPGI